MLIGEVHTGLLQHSTSLQTAESVDLLSLIEGANVMASQRPTSYVVSPDIPVGVDCLLPSASRRKVRCVGAALSRAVLSGGRVVQTSAWATVEPSAAGRRLPWSHYIASVGRLEAIGRTDWSDVVTGFLQPDRRSPKDATEDTLSLGGIAARLMDAVQGAGRLDRRAPFRSQRTRLRWTVTVDERPDATVRAWFTVGPDGLRTVEMTLGPGDAEAAQQLCEDLALHDWLLTTVTAFVEGVASSPRPVTDKAARLRPVVEHLLHLWMPGARVGPELQAVWDVFERRPGFSRQWTASVEWIRDQLASGTMAMLERAR
ncbi:SCO2521 family protein [Dactylosporangium sp. CS-033363]|uniref:SCO2521 family protein n=1 Tax=Dactylosporangium sp. CS-033363 TaxID=3239935 RepID=UPI003D8D6B87